MLKSWPLAWYINGLPFYGHELERGTKIYTQLTILWAWTWATNDDHIHTKWRDRSLLTNNFICVNKPPCISFANDKWCTEIVCQKLSSLSRREKNLIQMTIIMLSQWRSSTDSTYLLSVDWWVGGSTTHSEICAFAKRFCSCFYTTTADGIFPFATLLANSSVENKQYCIGGRAHHPLAKQLRHLVVATYTVLDM